MTYTMEIKKLNENKIKEFKERRFLYNPTVISSKKLTEKMLYDFCIGEIVELYNTRSTTQCKVKMYDNIFLCNNCQIVEVNQNGQQLLTLVKQSNL